MKAWKILALAVMSVALASCEEDNDKKLAEAQNCLDTSQGPSDATTCIQKVDGLVGPEASRIRCGGTYIQRGFTTATFTGAFDSIKNHASASDPILAMAFQVAFTGASAVTGRSASADGDFVMQECPNSGSPGLALLASATRVGIIAKTVGSCSDVNNLDGCLSGVSSSADLASMGQAARTVSGSYCASGTASTSDVCKQFNEAVAKGASDEAIGTCLKSLLNSNSTATCP